MSRPSIDISTVAEVSLKPGLIKKLRAKLDEYKKRTHQAKVLKGQLAEDKVELETLFMDADEYEALRAGVRVTTPFGDVPMKMIGGETKPKLNTTKLMKKFKLTPADLASCTDPGKPKKEYLGVYLPGEDEEEGE